MKFEGIFKNIFDAAKDYSQNRQSNHAQKKGDVISFPRGNSPHEDLQNIANLPINNNEENAQKESQPIDMTGKTPEQIAQIERDQDINGFLDRYNASSMDKNLPQLNLDDSDRQSIRSGDFGSPDDPLAFERYLSSLSPEEFAKFKAKYAIQESIEPEENEVLKTMKAQYAQIQEMKKTLPRGYYDKHIAGEERKILETIGKVISLQGQEAQRRASEDGQSGAFPPRIQQAA